MSFLVKVNYSALPKTEAEFQKLRQKLIMYFSGRRLSPAEDYADEVVMRAITKISEGEAIEDINKYVFGIAKFVCLEAFKDPKTVSIDPSGFIANRSDDPDGVKKMPSQLIEPAPSIEEQNAETICLRKCLGKLPDGKRELLIAFYKIKGTDKTHIEQRKQLANENGMSPDTLYTNICRLRKKVGDCVMKCVAE